MTTVESLSVGIFICRSELAIVKQDPNNSVVQKGVAERDQVEAVVI